MKLKVNLSRSGSGFYRAWCPALPGCAVWGASKREAKDKLQKAVVGYIENLNVALPRELARLIAGIRSNVEPSSARSFQSRAI